MKKVLTILILLIVICTWGNLNLEINNDPRIIIDTKIQIETISKFNIVPQVASNPVKIYPVKRRFYIETIAIGIIFLGVSCYCFNHSDDMRFPTVKLIGAGFGWCGINLIIKSIRF